MCEIQGNRTGNNGSGVYVGNSCKFALTDNIVSDNTSDGEGGAIYTSNSSIEINIQNSTIENNTVTVNGGGLCINSSNVKFTMNGGTISGNKASFGNGGGIYGKVNIIGNTVGNAANNLFLDGTYVMLGGKFDIDSVIGISHSNPPVCGSVDYSIAGDKKRLQAELPKKGLCLPFNMMIMLLL